MNKAWWFFLKLWPAEKQPLPFAGSAIVSGRMTTLTKLRVFGEALPSPVALFSDETGELALAIGGLA